MQFQCQKQSGREPVPVVGVRELSINKRVYCEPIFREEDWKESALQDADIQSDRMYGYVDRDINYGYTISKNMGGMANYREFSGNWIPDFS